MGQLYDRMARDLVLRNFSPATRRVYLLYCRRKGCGTMIGAGIGVMALADGGTLAESLKRRRKLPHAASDSERLT
jgi:hypothetical protein